MKNCKEFALDDLLAVTAIPVTDFVLGTAAWQLTPTIDSSYFNPVLDNAIVIGLQAAVKSDGTATPLIPIRRATGKAKDDESDSVAGRMHTVTLSCEVDDREAAMWNHLLTLERRPSHLLLTFRGGERAFAAATEDTYNCTVERDGAKTSVSIKVQNFMGIQLLT